MISSATWLNTLPGVWDVQLTFEWSNTQWELLGDTLGAQIRSFRPRCPSAAALGMIDDGSAEVLIDLDKNGELAISAGATIDLEWFLSLRCEQLSSGRHLVDLLSGLGQRPFRQDIAEDLQL